MTNPVVIKKYFDDLENQLTTPNLKINQVKFGIATKQVAVRT